MSEDQGNLGTHVLLFLLGAAAGALVVALTTPRSGPELRSDLKGLAAKLKRGAEAAGAACCGRSEESAEEQPDA
jgi:gas vesicle protein